MSHGKTQTQDYRCFSLSCGSTASQFWLKDLSKAIAAAQLRPSPSSHHWSDLCPINVAPLASKALAALIVNLFIFNALRKIHRTRAGNRSRECRPRENTYSPFGARASAQPLPHNPRKQRKYPAAAGSGDCFRLGKWHRVRNCGLTISDQLAFICDEKPMFANSLARSLDLPTPLHAKMLNSQSRVWFDASWRVQNSSTSIVIVAAKGPRMNPGAPNSKSPPMIEMNAGMV